VELIVGYFDSFIKDHPALQLLNLPFEPVELLILGRIGLADLMEGGSHAFWRR
jgi:hypothetical protein